MSSNARHIVQCSMAIECQRTRGRTCTSNVLPWRTPPALKALCIRTRRSSNPCRAHCQFCIPPAMPCISVPCPYEHECSIKAGRANLPHTPVLVSRRSRHHNIRKKHAMFLSRSLIQMPANEHCHPRKLFGSAVPFLPAQPTAPPAISALQGMFKKANHFFFLETQGGWRCMHAYV